jgi:hypothetical protein
MGRHQNPHRQLSQNQNPFPLGLQKMGYDQKQLKELMKPLYGFGGKRIEPVGIINLPISFGIPQNLHT